MITISSDAALAAMPAAEPVPTEPAPPGDVAAIDGEIGAESAIVDIPDLLLLLIVP